MALLLIFKKKFLLPDQHGSVVEYQPMNREEIVQSQVRAYTGKTTLVFKGNLTCLYKIHIFRNPFINAH